MPQTTSTTMGTESSGDSTKYVFSNDPKFAGLPDTPAPLECVFCGAERHTKGVDMFTRILWFPGGPQPCSCPDGIADFETQKEIHDAARMAELKEKNAAEMRDRVGRIIGASGLGERFLHRTFDSFTCENAEQRRNLAVAKEYADMFDLHLPGRGKPLPGRNGFLITGPKGTGKTHLAAAIANQLMRGGVSVICMTERNLFGRIKSTYNPDDHTDESVVRRLYETAPLLIIDDLGKERPTEWTLATLYAIIDGRYDRAMPLIVTANYDRDGLVKKITPDGGDKTTAETIVDRLLEMCKSIVMTGESWRSR